MIDCLCPPDKAVGSLSIEMSVVRVHAHGTYTHAQGRGGGAAAVEGCKEDCMRSISHTL